MTEEQDGPAAAGDSLKAATQVLFVHGMGRSSLSAWPLLWQLRRAGFRTTTFDYMVSLESFAAITERLIRRITTTASQGDDYVLIGHSLGGVLIRAAVNALPAHVRRPRHIFLLGSPVQPSRLAQRLARNRVFRAFTRDCGALLGSPQRMAQQGPVHVPVTGIAGVKGIHWTRGSFEGEANDGVVSLSEVSAAWLTDQMHIPVVHTWLPASTQVATIIVDRLASKR